MSRAAIIDLLRGDTQLATLGGPGFVVEAQHSFDQRPNDIGGFLVVCWRHVDFDEDVQANAEQHFDVYAHYLRVLSTDFGRINSMLDRVDTVFAAVADAGGMAGADGYRLDYIGFEGRGMDMTDDGYQTICRAASYMALSSKTPA